ncbi:Hypothetical protein FKW44_018665, partial [Caligus rogercresseyi]
NLNLTLLRTAGLIRSSLPKSVGTFVTSAAAAIWNISPTLCNLREAYEVAYEKMYPSLADSSVF